jgi:hypothetical protein
MLRPEDRKKQYEKINVKENENYDNEKEDKLLRMCDK